MKRVILYFIILVAAISITMACKCQTIEVFNPVKWDYTIKQTGTQLFVLNATATIKEGWHIYSQIQDDGAICQPTEFWTSFVAKKGRLISNVEEQGERKLMTSPETGNAYYYEKTVSFQTRVRALADTARMVLTIKYQACTMEKCLPPAEWKKVVLLISKQE